MRSIVINARYGEFRLSDRAFDLYRMLSSHEAYFEDEIERDDPALVEVVRRLGAGASGDESKLEIFHIPENIKESTRSEIPNITYITRRRTAGRNHIIGFVWYAPDAA